ncbi:MAG: Mur ligase family protein, partial [Spartobacteria bacterium]
MNLRKLLQSSGIPPGLAETEISSLCFDSREATPGCLFFALPGKNSDGTTFINQAAEKGAAAVIAEKEVPDSPCPVIVVADARAAMADIGGAFYEHPDRDLKCVGVTGTNGKTTTTCLVRHIFEHAAQRCGLIGTIKYIVADEELPAPHTTPESIDIQKILSEIRDTGGRAVAMEVSSHAIVQNRVRGIEFDAAAFTNLT